MGYIFTRSTGGRPVVVRPSVEGVAGGAGGRRASDLVSREPRTEPVVGGPSVKEAAGGAGGRRA